MARLNQNPDFVKPVTAFNPVPLSQAQNPGLQIAILTSPPHTLAIVKRLDIDSAAKNSREVSSGKKITFELWKKDQEDI